MPLTSMTDELLALRGRYEREGLHANAAAVEATLGRLRSHPRTWDLPASVDRESRFRPAEQLR